MLHKQFNIGLLFASKNCLYNIQNKLACFLCSLDLVYFLTMVLRNFVETNTCVMEEIHSDVRDSDVAYGSAFPVLYIYIYIQSVAGGMCQTSGGCSLC